MKNYLIGNWKMNLMPSEATELAAGINQFTATSNNTEVGVSPTFLALPSLTQEHKNSKLLIGAQNAHWDESGAWTGEISSKMLKELGTDFVIIGHSECRHQLGETQELISQRAKGVLDQDLKLVYCIGETLAENKSSKTLEVLKAQLDTVCKTVEKPELLIIAYEPVWAIGTGEVASPEDIKKVCDYLKDYLNQTLNVEVPILYGGSVKPDNYAEIIKLENVNGALVGGASLKVDSFQGLFEVSEASK